MDINDFRRHLQDLSESAIVNNKIGKQGYKGSDGWVEIQNSGIKDRSLWLPDKDDKANWSASELKGVYRWYVNDDPNNGLPGGTGLIKVDINAGTAQLIDQDKYLASGQKLVWGRKLKVKSVSVFKKEFLDHQ